MTPGTEAKVERRHKEKAWEVMGVVQNSWEAAGLEAIAQALADAELEGERRGRRGLYERVEPKEGKPIQFLGVYFLLWRAEWGEPTVGFRKVTREEDASEG